MEHTDVYNQVSDYLEATYPNEYIVYNLSKDLDKSGSNLNQVMEYPFPSVTLVDFGDEDSYMTAPPQLHSLFLVAIEISAWLK